MAIKSLSALSSKISSVLSPSLQLNSITNSINNLLIPIKSSSSLSDTFNGLLSNLGATKTFDFSALTKSLPQVINTIQTLTSSGSNSDVLKTLITTLQPLLQNLSGSSSSTQMNQLIQSLPTVINSVQGLINSASNQGNLPDSITTAINSIKPLLSLLGGASNSSDATQIVGTLNQVLEYAQPIIQLVGSISSSQVDYGQLAQGATTALLPLLASINKGDSSIDMNQLSHALPTIIGSVTNLVTAISTANQGNIPETISGVIKGVKPLLDLLANSDVINADQAQTVKAVYDVLNSVSTILDFVNNPSLFTLSTDLNHVIDSLKPVIALIDSSGEANQFLDNFTVPTIGDLFGQLIPEKLDVGSIADSLGQFGESLNGTLPNISDLLQSATGTSGQLDLSTLLPSINDSLGNIFNSALPVSNIQTATLLPSITTIEICEAQSYI